MNRRYLPMLVLLALIWGSSFMFIKVAVRELDPATLVFGRLGLAALVLGVVVLARSSAGERREPSCARTGLRCVVVGLLNTAVPFWLLSWGETRIDSGLASIIQASVPIFNALLAFGFFREQRVTGRTARRRRDRLRRRRAARRRAAARRRCSARSPSSAWRSATAPAACSRAGYLVGGAAARWSRSARPRSRRSSMMPAGVALAPDHIPGWKTIASIVVLGVVGTASRTCSSSRSSPAPGAAYASLVTYLVPPIALAYGAIFLGERFGASRVRRARADPGGRRARHAHEASTCALAAEPARGGLT